MADISKCENKECVMKEQCYRYTAPASPLWQAYIAYTPIINKKKGFSCNGLYLRT